MKNFPSTLIKQKTTRQGLGDSASSTIKNIGAKVLKNIFSNGNTGSELTIDGINKEINNGYEPLDIEHEIDNININNHHKRFSENNDGDIDALLYRYNQNLSLMSNLQNGATAEAYKVYFEDPFLFSSSIFGVINNYKYILGSTVPSILEHARPADKAKMEGEGKYDGDYHMAIAHAGVAPSLFNPYHGVSVLGITENVSLMISGNNDLKNNGNIELENGLGEEKNTPVTETMKNIKLNTLLPGNINADPNNDISDCTIKKLVELSNQPPESRELGMATYRYADFMFCKELGKISNNHLITLRKFPGPVGDNIFKGSYPAENNPFSVYPDVGRLITWFGTEDNKLENICRFNYNATWKEFTAEIQQKPSEQKDDGIVNQLANTFSAQNNRLISQGFSQNTGLLGWAASKVDIPIIHNDRMNSQYYDWTLLQNYDQNRIYEPQNKIWSTHKYEGRLLFNQEITLTFKYVLRSYSNINPKSAFLDLLGNIMAVTYRRGSFWGGETKIYGPQGNNSVYDTANAWIDKGFEKLGGIWTMVANGTLNMSTIQGWLSNIMESASEVLDKSKEVAKKQLGVGDEGKSNEPKPLQKANDYMTKLNKKYGWTNALKGMLKNQLGRPALYAFNSLLSGEEVGPWHITIGNPRNPIMSMGNMIMTAAEITQSGALGLDDFPTEIKLVVTLKHGRPRDAVEIEKMYTKGISGIYRPMNLLQLKSFQTNAAAFGDISEITSTAANTSKKDFNELKELNPGLANSIYQGDILQKVLRNI